MSRIIRGLTVRCIRGARKVDIHQPDPAVVEIAGDNGSGKSSTLDAVEWGIRGKRALPEQPLMRGAPQGAVTVDLGDLRITRRINEGNAARGGTVTIQAADGSKWGQRDVEALYGAWTFDPLAFARMKPEAQVAKLRSLAGPEFCDRLADLDAKIAEAESDRTEAGRAVKQFGSIADVPKVEPVDTAELTRRIADAREQHAERVEANAAIVRLEASWNMCRRDVEACERNLFDAEAALRRARDQLESAQEQHVTVTRQLADERHAVELLPDPPDMAALDHELATAAQKNADHAAWQIAEAKRSEWREAVATHQQLQQEVEDLRVERSAHLRTAKLPVDGLSWSDGKIALHGVPFGGLSTTEQLLLSARIGMAVSPDLRVMLVREGGLIDKRKFAALKELAAAEGYQVWMETAGDGHDADALVIEAGELSDAPDEWQE